MLVTRIALFLGSLAAVIVIAVAFAATGFIRPIRQASAVVVSLPSAATTAEAAPSLPLPSDVAANVADTSPIYLVPAPTPKVIIRRVKQTAPPTRVIGPVGGANDSEDGGGENGSEVGSDD